MKLYLAMALTLCAAVSAGLVAAQAGKPAPGDDAAVQADRAVVTAFEKGDKAALAKLLDADFSWIDTDGIMWEKPDVFRAGLKPLVPNASDVKIQSSNMAR